MVDTKITAVIMAGGKGTRLGNLVHEIPKPMVKINDVPIIERQIIDLKNSGIKDWNIKEIKAPKGTMYTVDIKGIPLGKFKDVNFFIL